MARKFLFENELGRFLIAGGTNTALTLALYYWLNLFIHYQLAYGLAYVAGVIISYFLNARFVFEATPCWRSFFSFPLIYVFQLLLNIVLLRLLIEVLGWPEWFSPLVVIVLGIPVIFLLSRYVFKKPV